MMRGREGMNHLGMTERKEEEKSGEWNTEWVENLHNLCIVVI